MFIRQASPYGSYNEYRKQLFGTVNLSKDAGVTLDEVWGEMAGMFPGIFDASEVDTDMFGILLDVVKAIRENRLGSETALAEDALIEQGLYQQVYESYWDAATMRSLGDQVQEGLRQLASLSDLYWDKDTQSDKLYSAIQNGDQAYYERMADNYDSRSSLQSAIRKGLRENDRRIGQAARAYLAGDMEKYTFLIEQIVGEGKFDEETVRAVVSAEISGERADARGDDAPDTDDLTAAYESGDNARAEEIMEELVAEKVAEYLLKAQAEAYEKGDSFDEADAREEAEGKARASVRSTLTRYWKPLYVAAYREGDVDECERIEDVLTDSGLYGNAKALRKTLKSWRTEN